MCRYELASDVSQARQLADLSLLVRDYPLAIENYRSVLTDYKNDQQTKLYAGAQEFLGLCLLLQSHSIASLRDNGTVKSLPIDKELEAAFEAAFLSYQATGASDFRFPLHFFNGLMCQHSGHCASNQDIFVGGRCIEAVPWKSERGCASPAASFRKGPILFCSRDPTLVHHRLLGFTGIEFVQCAPFGASSLCVYPS